MGRGKRRAGQKEHLEATGPRPACQTCGTSEQPLHCAACVTCTLQKQRQKLLAVQQQVGVLRDRLEQQLTARVRLSAPHFLPL